MLNATLFGQGKGANSNRGRGKTRRPRGGGAKVILVFDIEVVYRLSNREKRSGAMNGRFSLISCERAARLLPFSTADLQSVSCRFGRYFEALVDTDEVQVSF